MAVTYPTGPNGARTIDVAVVGGGPVGAVLALLLADRGRQVVVIERWASPYPLPRAVHFDDETARILQACGIGPVLPVLSEEADTYEWRNGESVPLLRLRTTGMGRSGWPAANMFNQPDLEAELNAKLDEHPLIEIHRGHGVSDVTQGADEVRLTVRPTPGKPAARESDESARPASLQARFAGMRRGQQHRAGYLESSDRGPRLLLRLADRRCGPQHAPGVRPSEPAGLSTPPAYHVSFREDRDGGGGNSCACPARLSMRWTRRRSVGAARTVGCRARNATMIRHAGYRFHARWATNWHSIASSGR